VSLTFADAVALDWDNNGEPDLAGVDAHFHGAEQALDLVFDPVEADHVFQNDRPLLALRVEDLALQRDVDVRFHQDTPRFFRMRAFGGSVLGTKGSPRIWSHASM